VRAELEVGTPRVRISVSFASRRATEFARTLGNFLPLPIQIMPRPRAVSGTPWVARSQAMRRWLGLTVLSIVVLVSCVALLRRGGLPIVPERYDSVPAYQLGLFAGSYLAVLVLRSLRWYFQLRPVASLSLPRVVSACVLGIIGIIVLPFRSGELVRPALIARRGAAPFLAALTTTLSERLVDAFSAALLLTFGLALSPVKRPLPDHIGKLPVPVEWVLKLGFAVGTLTLAAIGVVLAFYFFRRRALALIESLGARFSQRAADALTARLTDVVRGLDFLARPRELTGYLGFTVAYWGTHLLGLRYLLQAVGFVDCTLAQTAVLLGTLMFGASVPNSPGLFGVFQLASYSALALYWPAERLLTDGSVAAFWIYVIEIGGTVALAPLAWWTYVRSFGAQQS
jgi:glycosyltransferase 2 family protein